MSSAETQQITDLREAVQVLAEQLDISDARRHEMTERADRDLARAVDLNRELRRAHQKNADADAKVKSLAEMCDALREDLTEAQERALAAEERAGQAEVALQRAAAELGDVAAERNQLKKDLAAARRKRRPGSTDA